MAFSGDPEEIITMSGTEAYPVDTIEAVDAEFLHCEDEMLSGLDEVLVHHRSEE